MKPESISIASVSSNVNIISPAKSQPLPHSAPKSINPEKSEVSESTDLSLKTPSENLQETGPASEQNDSTASQTLISVQPDEQLGEPTVSADQTSGKTLAAEKATATDMTSEITPKVLPKEEIVAPADNQSDIKTENKQADYTTPQATKTEQPVVESETGHKTPEESPETLPTKEIVIPEGIQSEIEPDTLPSHVTSTISTDSPDSK